MSESLTGDADVDDLLQQYWSVRDSDPQAGIAIRNQIANRYWFFALKKAHDLANSRNAAPARDRDDFESAAGSGLLKAIESFDPNRGIRLSSYIALHCMWGVQAAGNRKKKRITTTQLAGDSVVERVSADRSPLDAVIQEEQRRFNALAMRQILMSLRRGERLLLHWHYELGWTFAEIARKMGYTREMVRKVVRKLEERVAKDHPELAELSTIAAGTMGHKTE